MSNARITRRSFTATGAALAAGMFAAPIAVTARQEATPVGTEVPQGYVSMRVRTVADAEARDDINEFVMSEFVPDVQALEGYGGYLLGDVIDNPAQSLSVLLMEQESQTAAFDALASDFVASISDIPGAEVVDTTQWSGDMLIQGFPLAPEATPVADPVLPLLREGYVAVRIHNSLPGTDPHDFVTLATDDFVPRLEELDGFEGYLWFPIETGFVAISLFDSEASAQASNDIAIEWADEFIADYTDSNPEIINASIVWSEFPLLARV